MSKKETPKWIEEFQNSYDEQGQIKLIGRGGFTRKQLVEMTKLSQLGTVLGSIWDQLTCDLSVGEETYRFHTGIDGYVIKRRTFGPDGKGYGGWSFHEQFPKTRAGKESALEAWIDLCAEGDDWNTTGACFGTINPGGEVETVETAVAVVEKSKFPTMGNLQAVATQLNEKTERFQVVEKEATMLMLEIGLTIEWVKEQLPHGQLMKWVDQNLTISKSHAARFRQLAQVFIRANSLNADECLLLCDPANSKEALGDKLRQMAFEFLGDRTQAELFEQYKIKGEKQKLEYHPPKNNGQQLPDGETPEHFSALHTWTEIGETIRMNGIDQQSWAHLTAAEREGLYDLIHELDKQLKASLKG